MKLPERKDFLYYVESDPEQSSGAQQSILALISSSAVVRQQIVEVKKDLYLVSVQVPEYEPTAHFGMELARLSDSWAKISYNRKFSVRHFYRSREFFGLILTVAAMLGLLLYFIGLGLI